MRFRIISTSRSSAMEAWRRLAVATDWEAQTASSLDRSTGQIIANEELKALPLCAVAATLSGGRDSSVFRDVRQELERLASTWSERAKSCLLQAFDVAVQS